MKKLLVLAPLLLSAFSAHATVVAEDTAEHTINFTFGRPTADVYLCHISLGGNSENRVLDTMTFPNGDSIDGNVFGGNSQRFFTRETAPTSSTLHLGTNTYGSVFTVEFCHDLLIPSDSPDGSIDTAYKIQTPAAWSYFNNSQISFLGYKYCPTGNINLPIPSGWNPLISNTASDYTLLGSIPFAAGSDPAHDCKTTFIFWERSQGPRPANETAGNITVGVKDVINFN